MIRLRMVVIPKQFHYIVSSYASSTFQVTLCVEPDLYTPPCMSREIHSAGASLVRALCVRRVINSIRNEDLLYWDALGSNGCLIGNQCLY